MVQTSKHKNRTHSNNPNFKTWKHKWSPRPANQFIFLTGKNSKTEKQADPKYSDTAKQIKTKQILFSLKSQIQLEKATWEPVQPKVQNNAMQVAAQVVTKSRTKEGISVILLLSTNIYQCKRASMPCPSISSTPSRNSETTTSQKNYYFKTRSLLIPH